MLQVRVLLPQLMKIGDLITDDPDFNMGIIFEFVDEDNYVVFTTDGKRYHFWSEVQKDGTIIRYLNGFIHSRKGPARENTKTGRKEWWIDNYLHRIEGPAIIHGDYESYYLRGQPYSKEAWKLAVDKIKKVLDKISKNGLHC
jgi:hypothetical protein